MKSDPPDGCEEIGQVRGEPAGMGPATPMESAKIDMRNEAAEMGANYVRMEAVMQNGAVEGTAYKCPE
ncbi:MAG: DUF4156 domain-containing protein [Deltaproteobacteria bacterium]|nr:DUF4156 domain-containing protein [Deltaproteobacteria bacterium]